MINSTAIVSEPPLPNTIPVAIGHCRTAALTSSVTSEISVRSRLGKGERGIEYLNIVVSLYAGYRSPRGRFFVSPTSCRPSPFSGPPLRQTRSGPTLHTWIAMHTGANRGIARATDPQVGASERPLGRRQLALVALTSGIEDCNTCNVLRINSIARPSRLSGALGWQRSVDQTIKQQPGSSRYQA